VDRLSSSETAFETKQAVWQQLKHTGKLDDAIRDLEQRAVASPKDANLPATLGQAYLQKAGSIQDVREQGILGMKADATFEAALEADPENWDARYWKTLAMSYWPTQLGKGPEVIENFLGLIKKQEMQSPQPHYAQTYVVLGEQYEKYGHADYAREVWKRGATLFPNDPALRQKAGL
jgi:tetratricopeptide (TPR) repeat protein